MSSERRRQALFILPAICTIVIILLLRGQYLYTQQSLRLLLPGPRPINATLPTTSIEPTQPVDVIVDDGPTDTHHVLYSLSTADRKYFLINTTDHEIYNANILPHPAKNDTWIVVGQMIFEAAGYYFAELHCNAVFRDGQLACVHSPLTLTIPASPAQACDEQYALYDSLVGPHDARAFYGPDFPITMYGNNGAYTCFTQFALDMRSLMQWPVEMYEREQFRFPTEIQRPAPYSPIEKNWFLFWDSNGTMYAHHDVKPRSFARIDWDGSTSHNLAQTSVTVAADERCLAKYVTKADTRPHVESIHQATNSLSVTLCNRSDPTCIPTDENTYIVSVFQHKIVPGLHSVYEPYAILFKQNAPHFTIHAISSKPIWIHGRKRKGEPTSKQPNLRPYVDESEMIYVTSMSWKTHGQKYHGFLDDEMFFGFGVEDALAGGIDFLAADLLSGLGVCDDLV